MLSNIVTYEIVHRSTLERRSTFASMGANPRSCVGLSLLLSSLYPFAISIGASLFRRLIQLLAYRATWPSGVLHGKPYTFTGLFPAFSLSSLLDFRLFPEACLTRSGRIQKTGRMSSSGLSMTKPKDLVFNLRDVNWDIATKYVH